MSNFRNGLSYNGPLAANGTTGTTADILAGDGFVTAETAAERGYRGIPPLQRTQRPDAYSVVLMLGQSNMAGAVANYTPNRQAEDSADPMALELSNGSTVVEGYRAAPDGELQVLRNPSTSGEAGVKFCPTLPFAKRLRALRPDLGRLVVINRALSGSHFSDEGASTIGGGTGDWNDGDAWYESVKSDVNTFMAANPGARITAICWHQGETDSLNGLSDTNYQSALTSLVGNIRADFTRAADAVFVCGTMTPSYYATGTGTVQDIDAVHRNVASFLTNADFVDLDAFTTTDTSAITHFAEDGIRYFGEELASKVIGLMDANVPPRVPAVWMEYDGSKGEFRDRNGGEWRVFAGAYADDSRYGGVLSIASSTGYNTDIPLNAAAYTKVMRVRIDAPTTSLSALQYQLLSGAVPGEEYVAGVTAAGANIGHWWSTRFHTHQAEEATFSGSALGASMTQQKWHTVALTYDSAEAAAVDRFKEYIDGSLNGAAGTTGEHGADQGSSNQIVQIGCHGSTAMSASWSGAVAAVITLPYCASAAEIATIHNDLEFRQRGNDPATNLGIDPVLTWQECTTPGSYGLVVLNSSTTDPVAALDLPWNPAAYAGNPAGLSVYQFQIIHGGSTYGTIVASAHATSQETGNIVHRRFSATIQSNATYTNDWTRVGQWMEETSLFDDSDGSIRTISFASGVPSYPQV